MTDSNTEANVCEDGASYHHCSTGSFSGCCSHDPCEESICYDQTQELDGADDIQKRDIVTTTITKILARDSGSESNITTTKTCTVTVTSTAYNTLTITSSSNLTSSSTPTVTNLAALRSIVSALPSIIKPSSASTGRLSTKTSTHTSSAVTTTKALIPVPKNGTATLQKADAQNSGRVAGITIGSLAGAVMIGLLMFLCCRRRRKSKETSHDTDSTMKAPDTPAVESGGKRKFIFGSENGSNDDKVKTVNQQGHEQSDKIPNSSFLARTASRLSQIHPALRSEGSSRPNTTSNQSHDNGTSPYVNSNTSLGPGPSRFYSNNNQTHDIMSENHAASGLPPINIIRASTKKSKEINKSQHSPSSPKNQYTYDPQTLIVPARNNSDNKSINSSISPTPTNMIGPVSSSPVEQTYTNKNRNRDIGRALTTPAPNHTTDMNGNTSTTNQESPDYILPSQRPGRKTTPSIWTDATIPYTPAFGLPAPMNPTHTSTTRSNISQTYTAYRPSSPSANTAIIKDQISITIPTSDLPISPPPPPKITMKRKPIMKISTSTANAHQSLSSMLSSGTTTESDILSPRHQLQEPTRRRKSLFQSPGGMDDDDEAAARRKDWI